MFYIIIFSLCHKHLKCLIIDGTLPMFGSFSVGKIMAMPFIRNFRVNASKNPVEGSCHENEDEITRPISVNVINIV